MIPGDTVPSYVAEQFSDNLSTDGQQAAWLSVQNRAAAGRILHDVQHAAHGLLVEGVDQQVKAHLLVADTVKPKPALRQSEPAGRLVLPECRQP